MKKYTALVNEIQTIEKEDGLRETFYVIVTAIIAITLLALVYLSN